MENTVKRILKVSHRWEKLYTKHIYDRGFDPNTNHPKNSTIIIQTTQFRNGKKNLNTLSEKMYRWQISRGGDSQHHLSWGNCKLKQWNTPTYLLEWVKPKKQTIQIAGKDAEQEELSFITGRSTMVQTLWKTVCKFLAKLNIVLP